MKKPMVCLTIALVCAVGAGAQPAPIADNPEVASAIRLLEAWIEAQMAYRDQPGLSIGVVYDQQLVWAKGFGYADREKKILATPSTIYRMASHTKLFTATAIMQLRDGRKLQLDDPVVKHLPWFSIRTASPDAPVISIRHLLTHTSGLPREAASPYWTDFQFPTPEQIRQTLPGQQAVFPPETRWKYSNLALTLAGEIVAAVSGETYETYIERHILAPLGMKSSSVILPERDRSRLATGYGRRLPDGTRAVMPFTDCKGIVPAANLSSTVADFAQFVSLQFRENQDGKHEILKGATLREMHRVHWMQPDWKAGWGLGFQVWRADDKVFFGHGGSLAGYRTQTAISPKDKVAVVVMTNADDGNPRMYVDQAFKYVAPAITKATAPPASPKPADAEWSRYAGRYRSAWGDSQVLVLDGELVMIDPTTPDPKETMAKLVPMGKNSFRLESDSGFAEVGEMVSFPSGPGGEVAGMKVGENTSRRLGPQER